MVVQWYRKYLGTPFEGCQPVELYHPYVGHDDNRDWYMFTQVETQLTVSKILNVWHPQVVYDVHQMGSYSARMFIPPFLDPVDPNIDPLIVQETSMLGTSMAAALATAGKKGVVVNAVYDFWAAAASVPGLPRGAAHSVGICLGQAGFTRTRALRGSRYGCSRL